MKQDGQFKFGRGKRGAALVEFALTLPLLALLLFAIIQYGFIFATYMSVRNASAVAARYAALGTTPSVTEIENVARGALGPLLQTNAAGLTITVQTNVTVGGEPAKSVQIVYPLDLIIPFVVPGPDPMQVRAITYSR